MTISDLIVNIHFFQERKYAVRGDVPEQHLHRLSCVKLSPDLNEVGTRNQNMLHCVCLITSVAKRALFALQEIGVRVVRVPNYVGDTEQFPDVCLFDYEGYHHVYLEQQSGAYFR